MGNFALGLSGYGRAGKTAAAQYLKENYGFSRLHIAEPFRAMLAVLMRANGISDAMITRYLEGDLKDGVPIPELGGRTSRDLQISLGTAWGRSCVHPDLWANTWMRSAAGIRRAMNDSVRFVNEERAIRDLGGVTILIRRPGTHPIAFKWGRFGRFLYQRLGLMWGVHDSERTDWLKPDVILDNDGDLDSLYRDLDDVMLRYGLLPMKAVYSPLTAA